MSLADGGDQDQTASSVQSDLNLHCPQGAIESRLIAKGLRMNNRQ